VETQQSDHAPKSGPEFKDGRSSTKDCAPEKLRCWTIKKEASWILQIMFVGTARRILLRFNPSIDKRTKEGCDHGNKVGTVHSRQGGEGPVSLRKSKV